MVEIQGTVAPGFEPVREAFSANFSDRNEIGGAFTAYHRGHKVVDIWGGESGPGRPWQEDTTTLVWSATKGMSALVAQLLVDHGALDLNRAVADYWPEFASGGKGEITVLDILTHGARLPWPPGYPAFVTADDITGWDDPSPLVGLLEQAEPVLEAGHHGYHALTFGLLLGEVVERATGRTLGTVFRDEIAEPLGLTTRIGTPPTEQDSLAELSLTIPPPPTDDPEILAMMAEALGPEGPTGRCLLVGQAGPTQFHRIGNDTGFRAAEYPAANGTTDARSLARMYALLAMGGELDGLRLVSEESVERHRREQWRGIDESLGAEKRYATGYMLAGTESETFGPNPDSFGHPGMGGSLGFADPENGVGYGYVTNHMIFEVAVDPRALALAEALYASI
ncbi:MAG TPA: class A beta-lactamase-related serine hydrolase [Acidimicrobiales bacterium]|nr:class A beta-lactamase-related serine hydrolase [Acidimicrobiales bacterium]